MTSRHRYLLGALVLGVLALGVFYPPLYLLLFGVIMLAFVGFVVVMTVVELTPVGEWIAGPHEKALTLMEGQRKQWGPLEWMPRPLLADPDDLAERRRSTIRHPQTGAELLCPLDECGWLDVWHLPRLPARGGVHRVVLVQCPCGLVWRPGPEWDDVTTWAPSQVPDRSFSDSWFSYGPQRHHREVVPLVEAIRRALKAGQSPPTWSARWALIWDPERRTYVCSWGGPGTECGEPVPDPFPAHPVRCARYENPLDAPPTFRPVGLVNRLLCRA